MRSSSSRGSMSQDTPSQSQGGVVDHAKLVAENDELRRQNVELLGKLGVMQREREEDAKARKELLKSRDELERQVTRLTEELGGVQVSIRQLVLMLVYRLLVLTSHGGTTLTWLVDGPLKINLPCNLPFL